MTRRLVVIWGGGTVEVAEMPTRLTIAEARALARLLRTGAAQTVRSRA